ncbi:MAG: glutamate--tRNA ligase [Candidatus Bathyarchaeia archaeon]|nr:glutamate--tRNA ligase [Candidatus Bathyarchaeota archaeon A05DMB-4]MDH7594614.1 glutamate--tRNA ligase [Candidatus Bathyarchaeota archaeon]
MANKETREIIRKLALINAVGYGGKAQAGPVMGKLLAELPELKTRVKEIGPIVAEVIREVNAIPVEEQRKIIERNWPETLVKEKVEEEKRLPKLPNVESYERVVTRFSPNPDCAIHLGSARAIILCHEYARMYKGSFILRFEDTDPRLKRSALPFYDSIREDLAWLGCKPDEEFIQSDRIPIYYEHAEKLLKDGNAYVCTCNGEEFKKKLLAQQPCPCRNLPPKEHLERWQKMLDGTFKEGEAVVRVKTDLSHPNPAVRDWPALRIIDPKTHPHPRVGRKYRVWPLYNLACGVDDHLMGISHIIRGKEHLTNQVRQEFMYKHFGWRYPEAIHYGRMKIVGAFLSKSKIVAGMREGLFKGWDDPRLATFAALRRRGIQPEAIKRMIIDVGPKAQDVTLSWDNLYAYNRKIIDPTANRYFFVHEPMRLVVRGLEQGFVARLPLHPDHPEKGFRQIEVKPKENEVSFHVSRGDLKLFKKDNVVRLMELFNIKIEQAGRKGVEAVYHSHTYEDAKKLAAPLVHWLPEGFGVPCTVVMPDASEAKGIVEEGCKKLRINDVVQFERFGFVRIDAVDKGIVAYYAHR